MGALAVITAIVLDKQLADPEGFLGPSWLRLPLLLLGAFLLDVLPRTLWQSRLDPRQMRGIVRERVRSHWTRERMTLVVMGLVCFYITYVSYRNLKSFLPFVMGEEKYDRELHIVDTALFLGHDPSNFLHTLLGTDVLAHPLSAIYLWFLPLVPLALTAWLIWSPNISYGYWFATSQCVAWALGTASYYALPTLGPGLEYPWLYDDLANTPTASLMDSLVRTRQGVIEGGLAGRRAVGGRLRQPALRGHAPGRADGAVHPEERGCCTTSSGPTSASRSWPRSTSAGTTSPMTSPAS